MPRSRCPNLGKHVTAFRDKASATPSHLCQRQPTLTSEHTKKQINFPNVCLCPCRRRSLEPDRERDRVAIYDRNIIYFSHLDGAETVAIPGPHALSGFCVELHPRSRTSLYPDGSHLKCRIVFTYYIRTFVTKQIPTERCCSHYSRHPSAPMCRMYASASAHPPKSITYKWRREAPHKRASAYSYVHAVVASLPGARRIGKVTVAKKKKRSERTLNIKPNPPNCSLYVLIYTQNIHRIKCR